MNERMEERKRDDRESGREDEIDDEMTRGDENEQKRSRCLGDSAG
jgi:hypothetical protein